jgi:predicted O-linked N-acetylglucosamine transferase (SPINDLY family)
LTGAFDEFLDLDGASNQQAVNTLRDRRIDIAIDLMGFTAGHRFDIFETRVAPIQVNYLGFAATIGSVSHDYLLADEYVVPEEAKSGFIEQVVYLPGSYLAMSRRPIAPGVPTRKQAGLPAEGRVFCAFNNQYKISPALFDTWMRILTRVPGSVLWLRLDSEIARANLLKKAALRGVDADRLIFAPRVADHADHMARLGLADVFLDTFPYNAHATATDALLAGVPVITRSGRAFASRVAGSLLCAAGCPELVVDSLEDYERLAVELALDDSRLTALRNKVRANAAGSEMFDPERYCRGLEAAYLEMCRRREPERAES